MTKKEKELTKQKLASAGVSESIAEQLIGSDSKISSLEDSLSESMEKYVKIKDSYGNSLTSTGTEDIVEQYSEYDFSNDTLNWLLWTALYNDSWIFKRCIDKPSTDMVRCGFNITDDDLSQEQKQQVYNIVAKFRKQLISLCKWGALYGGSIAVVMFDNLKDEDYKNPMNVKKIRQAKSMRLYVCDRWFGIEPSSDNVKDMNSIDYGKPKSYNVTFANGDSYEVHHDYVIRYEHREAPKMIQTGQLMNWGYAEGAHILRELSRDDQLKTAITSLINKSLIEVIKMDGMRAIFMGQDEESKAQLQKRLEMVNYARTFNSLTFLDSDDEYQEHGFSGLSGLSDLLEVNMWQISAALEMQGVLFGDLKNGFSNDVDALERYDETILNRCEDFYRPCLEKLLHIIYKKLNINKPINFDFISLLIKKHDEEQMESIKKFQELLSGILGDGVITTVQYAKSLKAYSQNNKIDFFIEDEDLENLKKNESMEEELDNLDLDEIEEDEEEQDINNKFDTKQKDSLFKKIFKRKVK